MGWINSDWPSGNLVQVHCEGECNLVAYRDKDDCRDNVFVKYRHFRLASLYRRFRHHNGGFNKIPLVVHALVACD